jgi:hypothetical protein
MPFSLDIGLFLVLEIFEKAGPLCLVCEERDGVAAGLAQISLENTMRMALSVRFRLCKRQS